MLRRCASIVRGLSTSCSATSRLVLPAATSSAISCSRPVSGPSAPRAGRVTRWPSRRSSRIAVSRSRPAPNSASAASASRSARSAASRSSAAASARPSASRARAAVSGAPAAPARDAAASSAAATASPCASRSALRARSSRARAKSLPAARSAAARSRRAGGREVAGGDERLEQVRRRDAALGRQDPRQRRAAEAVVQRADRRARVAGGDERRAEAPAGLAGRVDVGPDPERLGVARVAQRRRDVTRGEPRPRERRRRPQQRAGVRAQARELEPVLRGGHRVGDPAELDQRRDRLHRQHQHDRLPARVRRDREPAVQRLERFAVATERAQRAAVHREGREPGGELSAVRLVECRGRLGERVRRRWVGGEDLPLDGAACEAPWPRTPTRRARGRRRARRGCAPRVVERAGRERGEREREPQPDPVERRLRRQIRQRDLQPCARRVSSSLSHRSPGSRGRPAEREALLGRAPLPVRRAGWRGRRRRRRTRPAHRRAARGGRGAVGVCVGQERQRGGEQLRGASGRRRAKLPGRLRQHRRRCASPRAAAGSTWCAHSTRPRAAPLELARGACVRTEPPPARRARRRPHGGRRGAGTRITAAAGRAGTERLGEQFVERPERALLREVCDRGRQLRGERVTGDRRAVEQPPGVLHRAPPAPRPGRPRTAPGIASSGRCDGRPAGAGAGELLEVERVPPGARVHRRCVVAHERSLPPPR